MARKKSRSHKRAPTPSESAAAISTSIFSTSSKSTATSSNNTMPAQMQRKRGPGSTASISPVPLLPRHNDNTHASSTSPRHLKPHQPPTWQLYLRLLPLVAIAAASVYGLVLLVRTLPPLDDGETVDFSKVATVDDVRHLAARLRLYSDAHRERVGLLFAAFFLFKQTFSIPGTLALNLIAGSLYGTAGSVAVILLTGIGASLCYLLSKVFAAPLIRRSWITARPHGRLARLARRVRRESRAGTLAYYLLFLRLFPFTPNWLLNLAAPVVGVPLMPFFASAVAGLAPYNIVTTQAGALLATVHSFADVLQPATIAKLAAVAAASLVPVWLKRRNAAAASAAAAGTSGDSEDEMMM